MSEKQLQPALLLLVFLIGVFCGGLFWHLTIRQPQVQVRQVQTMICEYIISPRYLDQDLPRDPGLIYPGDE